MTAKLGYLRKKYRYFTFDISGCSALQRFETQLELYRTIVLANNGHICNFRTPQKLGNLATLAPHGGLKA